MKTPEEVLGFEHDWLACDSKGHVALMSTAGGGYAPAAFLRDTDLHDMAIDAILASPPSCETLFYPWVGKGLENTWRLCAERGLFAYDSDVEGGPYKLVAAPSRPILVAQLPAIAARAAAALNLGDFEFAKDHELTKAMLVRSMNNEGMKVVLGEEWDDGLRSRLLDVLRELGATELSRDWMPAGGGDLETLKVKVSDQVLDIEAETYMGLSVTGPRDLVERVQRMMRR